MTSTLRRCPGMSCQKTYSGSYIGVVLVVTRLVSIRSHHSCHPIEWLGKQAIWSKKSATPMIKSNSYMPTSKHRRSEINSNPTSSQWQQPTKIRWGFTSQNSSAVVWPQTQLWAIFENWRFMRFPRSKLTTRCFIRFRMNSRTRSSTLLRNKYFSLSKISTRVPLPTPTSTSLTSRTRPLIRIPKKNKSSQY